MMKSLLAVILLAAVAQAQIPSLGFCPEYLPMAGFDMERFSGIWYEAERYFQLSEVASRCVKSNYTRGPDGKFRVLNEVTSIFTGIKRVVEGEIRKAPSKAEEGRLHVKYTSVPLIPLETQYNVLETDYKNYAVLWSCSGVGPVNTQNAWIMTRKRVAAGDILQRAYGVLDKYKISKLFFMKTNQDDCAYLDTLEADQNIRPPAEPIRNDADEEDSDEAPQPLTKAAAPVVPGVAPVAPVEAVPVAAPVPVPVPVEIPAVKTSVNEVKDSVVNAVKNAAEAVKKAANAIKNAAIKQPAAAAPVEAAAAAAAAAPVQAAVDAVAPVIKEEAQPATKSVVSEVVPEKQVATEEVKEAAAPVVAVKAAAPAPVASEPEKKVQEEKKVEEKTVA